ncbi:MAG: PKD domain-containing protein [Verrucomicrobia bacterium]|nr:PKD domain-containing protein [Verrucomicrobiota bacterium]
MCPFLSSSGGWRVSALLLAFTWWVSSSAAVPNLPPSPRSWGGELLRRGQDAIDSWGTELPEIAKSHRISVTELHWRLRTDSSLAVDPRGRLLFTDSADLTGPASGTTGVTATTLATPLPAEAFQLHSRPGAKRTIYLDFNGERMTDNAWAFFYNGGAEIVAAPYDSDGKPTTFNDTERSRIIQVWQRVAEDFAPFDVDVTTELTSEDQLTRSDAADDVYGVRVLVSPLTSIFGNYGGVSYVGTFNEIGDFRKPSLVFSDALGVSNPKNIAEAASHEAGHALGLSHDGVIGGTAYFAGNGSGETGWAPIMGVGYSRNLTQWSRGEYTNANNTQDDLAVMITYGLSHRLDDHGNTSEAASYFPVGTQLSGGGIIERSTDVDVFAFSAGAGPLTLTIAAFTPGPNLDIRAELRTSSGALLGTSNPGTTLGASFNLTVPAGTYFLIVQGTGKGAPPVSGYTSYGSLGQYTITGTVVSPTVAVAPVAVAQSDVASGPAPLAVRFDGSLSFDTDTSISGYEWDFGDGTGASGIVVDHSYLNPGQYTATLTVTDEQGLSHSDSVVIEVTNPAINQPPVASIAVSTSSGTTPLAVMFDGSGSRDLDGDLVAYEWNFGDGSSGQGTNVQKTFVNPGTYIVTLRVTDDEGAANETSTSITATPPVTSTVLRIQSITVTSAPATGGTILRALVTITTLTGTPVAGVSVTGRWAGVLANNKTKLTDATGQVLIDSKVLTSGSQATFSLTKVALTGYTYDPTQNVVSTVVVTVP